MSRLIGLPVLAALKFLLRSLFGTPGERNGELLTRDFVRLPNPSDVVAGVLGRHTSGTN
jgi:hypothetical protein